MRRWLFSLLLIIINLPSFNPSFKPPIHPPPPGSGIDHNNSQLTQAILEKVHHLQKNTAQVTLYNIQVTNIQISKDQKWATAWLVFVHPETGQILPTEPGFVIAQSDQLDWNVILPQEPGWPDSLASLPDELISEHTRLSLTLENLYVDAVADLAALEGYRLPWESGETVYLSRSLAHDRDITSGNAHFSFDFYVPSTMFNIHAARAGTVYLFKDDVPNNDHNDVNYLVLQDTTTIPTTYQLYLHLAQNSIPINLKSIGAQVSQGQFIGIADNTGQSTGHHLHFQVESLPYWTYWGRSLDVTFEDVDINGGRPRVQYDLPYCQPTDVCSQTRPNYVSGNIHNGDREPPYGDLNTPVNGVVIETDTLFISGWSTDNDSGIASAKIKAKYNNTWHTISPTYSNSPFSFTWNLCAEQVPDGPISLALEIQDNNGNWAVGLPGLRHFVKNYTCSLPPACIPGVNQVALYSEPDYEGICSLYGVGSYSGSAMGEVGQDNASSFLSGGNVSATLFMGSNFTGRGETFINNDSNLDDNRIGSDQLSSLDVRLLTSTPASPRQIWPLDGASFPTNASLTIVGEDAGGSLEFRLEIDGTLSNWQENPVWHLGSLDSGAHAWRIKSRNVAGESAWSITRTFNLSSAALSSDIVPVPYSDNMENGYNGWKSSSNWDQSLAVNHTNAGQVSWAYEVNSASVGYDNGLPNYGDLTSPKFNIPATGYFLRFWYLYETEGPGIHWDQRWIQISVNGNPFTNLLQLSDDPPNIWLQSPIIDLSSYAGSAIQIRFHFVTVDAAYNNKRGWYIDDFSISTNPPSNCPGIGEPDDTPAQANPISPNTNSAGEICPGGDVDYFQFTGQAGDQIGVSTRAQSINSSLDTYLYLLDSDGTSVLASNDDQVLGSRTDSFLSYRLKRSGTYYIKLLAWDHPAAGSNNHNYLLDLHQENTDPEATFVNPPESTFLPTNSVQLSVSALDSGSGVSHVEFYWHSGDWMYSDWNFLGSDWDYSNGWTFDFSTNTVPDQRNIAFYAKTFDWAGNSIGSGVWNLWLDRTPPVSLIQSITDPGLSNVVQLTWTSSDNLAGVDHFDIQTQANGGAWQDWLIGVEASIDKAWFVGSRNNTYNFRMRAVDRIGNTENYPASAEASITMPIQVCYSGDSWEDDNSLAKATLLTGVGERQRHNFCNPIPGFDWAMDQDWYQLNVIKEQIVTIHVIPLSTGTAPVLQLYNADGSVMLAERKPTNYGESASLYWHATSNSTIFIKIAHINPLAAGEDLIYDLIAQQGYTMHLPYSVTTR